MKRREVKSGKSSILQSFHDNGYKQPNPEYRKSEAGIAQYKELGLPYPDTVYDRLHQEFLERTPTEDNPYASQNTSPFNSQSKNAFRKAIFNVRCARNEIRRAFE
jgi:hypothetical protein